MRVRVLGAAVLAVALLAGLFPPLGLTPSVAAKDDAVDAVLTVAVVSPTTGYDISWPQCGGAYPSNPAFGIVGVNGGIVFSPNPCLPSELTWAGGARAGLYANTGNPGPALSRYWPIGQTSPQVCDAGNSDSAACAFDYGYNAAADSFATAVAAFGATGITSSPAANTWWLDVETSNSWRSDVALNVAALSGAVEYLHGVAGVANLGFYSTQYQWNVITGGTATFAAHPSWVAGAANADAAATMCAGPGFTGGGVALVQFLSGGFDADVRCDGAGPVLSSISVSPSSLSLNTDAMQTFTATGLDLSGRPLLQQPAFTWSVTGGGTIDAATGVFRAGPTAGGPFTVTATSGTVSGNATVTVTAPPAGDFGLAVSPSSRTVKHGKSASYTVTISRVNGFNGPVALSVSGQPAGSSVTFSANPATTSSTLTIKTAASAPKGTFALRITGSSGGATHTADGATLTITR